jgi:START domain
MIAVLIAASLAGVPADLRFEPWFVERGVEVTIARAAAGAPWIRGVAELPASAPRVFDEVSRYDRYRAFFDPVVVRASLLEVHGRDALIHLVWDYPFPYRNRDAVVAYRGEERPGGAYLLSWRDAARPGDPSEGVRIHRVAGETAIEPLSSERCRVTYTYLAELGGRFSNAIEEKAWRHEPVGYMLAIRRSLGLPIPAR